MLATFVCLYFGAWEATKRHANSYDPRSVRYLEGTEAVVNASAPAPFLLVRHEIEVVEDRSTIGYTRYYFWCFGYLAKLPYEKNDGYVLTY